METRDSWDSCRGILKGLKRQQEWIKWPGASDETAVFPKNKVFTFFEDGNKIRTLGQCSCMGNTGCLSARGFTDMEVSQIQEGFTSVLGFLVYIERGNRIFDFIQSGSTDKRISEAPLEDPELIKLIYENGKVIEDYEVREIRKIHHQFFLPDLRYKPEHYEFDCVRSLPLNEIAEIGDGGFSHVYRAKVLDGYHDFGEIEKIENGEVAVKLFKGQKDYGRQFCRRERMHNELWRSHRYIIPLLASLNRGGHYMIIFPLANYDLQYLMSKAPPPEYLDGRKAWFQFANLLSALDHIHTSNDRKGYHFDLKPQNVLVRGNGDWALTDFGIAHSKEDEFTSATGMDGSRGEYSPPEKNNVRRSFDIWSMGCIGCEILQWLDNRAQSVEMFRSGRGQHFYDGNGLKRAVLNVLKSASIGDWLTTGVAECLYKMLRIAPEERITAKAAEVLIREIMGIPEKNFSDTLSRAYKLTSTYTESQKEAEGLHTSIVRRRIIILGEDHPDTLTTIVDLANTYYNLRQFSQVERLELYVIEKLKTVLGEDHPDTLSTMHNLASTYRSLERFSEAERLEQHVMEKSKAVLGEDHPDTLSTMHELANTYHSLERFPEAERLGQYVIEKRKTVLGEDHPDTLSTMHNLAITYRSLERFPEAERLEQYVIEKRKAVLGEDHPDTLSTMHNLASTYWSLERFSEAERLEQYVIEKSKAVLGEDHPDTLLTIYSLAITYRSLERFSEAERLEQYVMEKERIKNHPGSLSSKHPMNGIYEGTTIGSIYARDEMDTTE